MNQPLRLFSIMMIVILSLFGLACFFLPAVRDSALLQTPKNYLLGGVLLLYAAYRATRTFKKKYYES